MSKVIFGILSFVLSFGATIPYCFDVVKGRAKLARSTRTLFLFLLLTTLFVQHTAFTSWTLALTVGEVGTQVLLFGLSFRYGVGGWTKLDQACYLGFAISLTAYLLTNNATLSLSLLILTDFIAFLPTIVKIWRDPTSDTWFFFVVAGMLAALASLLARDSNRYDEIIFPLYIFVTNGLAAFPILAFNQSQKHAK